MESWRTDTNRDRDHEVAVVEENSRDLLNGRALQVQEAVSESL